MQLHTPRPCMLVICTNRQTGAVNLPVVGTASSPNAGVCHARSNSRYSHATWPIVAAMQTASLAASAQQQVHVYVQDTPSLFVKATNMHQPMHATQLSASLSQHKQTSAAGLYKRNLSRWPRQTRVSCLQALSSLGCRPTQNKCQLLANTETSAAAQRTKSLKHCKRSTHPRCGLRNKTTKMTASRNNPSSQLAQT